MSENISITGLVATTPRHIVTQDGLAITSFRLASSQRRFDRNQNKWIDGDTNWYTVTAFKTLAKNVAEAVSKGDRIMVTGALRVRDWDNGERAGTSVEVEAEAVGHDMTWGTTTFTRTMLVRDDADFEDVPSDVLLQNIGTEVATPKPEHTCSCRNCLTNRRG